MNEEQFCRLLNKAVKTYRSKLEYLLSLKDKYLRAKTRGDEMIFAYGSAGELWLTIVSQIKRGGAKAKPLYFFINK